MSEQDISLKAVNDLRLDDSGQPILYWIAAYQLGYRWTAQQVTQLLEDIGEFTRRADPQPTDFYCLQPLATSCPSRNPQSTRRAAAQHCCGAPRRVGRLVVARPFACTLTLSSKDALTPCFPKTIY
jgi:hypothetical protein